MTEFFKNGLYQRFARSAPDMQGGATPSRPLTEGEYRVGGGDQAASMIEVSTNLFVGSQADEAKVRGGADWFVVSAAKEPYHRDALGYVERGAPKDDPEYLMAYRDGTLILNLVDVADPKFIADAIVEAAIEAIAENLHNGKKVLVHCNLGGSRGPTLALLYLHRNTQMFAGMDYDMAAEMFSRAYPDFAPAKGMELYARAHW